MTRHPFLTATLVGALLLAACGDGDESSEPTSDATTDGSGTEAPAGSIGLTLQSNSIKGGKNDQEATYFEDELIPAFEAAMDEAGTPVSVEFTGQGVDDEDYKTQISLDLSSGSGADVFAIDGIWVGEFAEAEYIESLTETVGDTVDEWDGWDQIPESVQSNMMFDGERYGVPSGTDGRVIYFNKEIFAKAGLPEDWQPATVDEVLEAARTIKESQPDVTPIQLNAGVAMGEATTMQGILPLLAAAGAEIYDEESSMWTGATPEMVQVLETYATVYGDEGLGDPDLQVRQDGRDRSFLEFSEGKIAMLLESDYFWRDVINPEAGVAPMENRDEVVGWASIPGYEPGGALGGNDAASMSGGGGFLVNPNSENAEMAWELLKFMNSKESVTQGAGDTPKITQREDVNAEILDVDPMLKYIAEDVLPVTHYRPGLAQYPQVSVAMQEASEAVVTGTSADDAAADYQSALERIVGDDAVNGG